MPKVKMFLLSKKFYAGGEIALEFINPVKDNQENKELKRAFSSVHLMLTLTDSVKDIFELGEEYYVEFKKAG